MKIIEAFKVEISILSRNNREYNQTHKGNAENSLRTVNGNTSNKTQK